MNDHFGPDRPGLDHTGPDHSGKVAFVTGAAGGIGLAMARKLGARGMKVMLADIDQAALDAACAELSAEGVECASVICDVSREQAVRDAAKATLDRFGKVHFVVNNAGVSLGGPTGDIAVEDWNWIVSINLMGVVHGVEAFTPILAAQGEGGHILNTASMAGHLAISGGAPYTATKYAVVGYSESLRQELGPQGIGVSVLCPGWVRTGINETSSQRPSLQGGPETREKTEPGEDVAAATAAGLDPDVLADWTLARIDEGRFYIFSQPELAPFVEGRFAEIKTDLEASRAIAELAEAHAAAKGAAPLDVLVVGAGFSGVCAAIRLKENGIENFAVYDKCEGIGGTWWLNTYPGAACDIPSHFYCYSFEMNPNWSRLYAPQPEIQQYIEDCAAKYGVRDRIHLGREIASIAFDDADGLWTTTFGDGEVVRSRFVINGGGGLHKPFIPDIDGIDNFAGAQMHTARWDHSFDPAGKRIAVIGSAASAIQATPQLAEAAEHVTLFQRTPNFIAPRNDFAYSAEDQEAFRTDPTKMAEVREGFFVDRDTRLYPIVVNPAIRKIAGEEIKTFIRSQVDDASLQDRLIPDFELGCKRILISDDFLPCLNRDNVVVETSGIECVTTDGVVTSDGSKVKLDAIIFATGFDLEGHRNAMSITGAGGVTLADLWRDQADAYRSSMIPEFPNYFMVTGPNAGVGTTSVVFLIEQAVEWIIDVIKLAGRDKLVSPSADACAAHSADIHERLGKTVWASGCDSWYIASNGRNGSLFAGNGQDFADQMSAVALDDLIITDAPGGASALTPNWVPRRGDAAPIATGRKLDPTIKAVLFAPDAQKAPSIASMEVADARAYYKGLVAKLEAPLSLTCDVEEGAMELSGRSLAYRIYRPAQGGPLSPAMVFFHGGGWVIGDLDTHDNSCRALALRSGCAIISVDYRRAPEHPFPTPMEDGYDAYVWVPENALRLGFDPARLGVGGDSAGGNIAAAVALSLRDRKGPFCAWQTLIYPAVNALDDSASLEEFAKGYGLDAEVLDWFAGHHIPDGADRADQRLSPLLAGSLAGLPPAIVVTGGFDPLRDSGEAYAVRLREAGVTVEYREYPDLIHGFMSWAGLVPSAGAALDEIGKLISRMAEEKEAALPA